MKWQSSKCDIEAVEVYRGESTGEGGQQWNMTATDTALFARWPNLPLILEFLEFSAVQNIQYIIFIILLPERTKEINIQKCQFNINFL